MRRRRTSTSASDTSAISSSLLNPTSTLSSSPTSLSSSLLTSFPTSLPSIHNLVTRVHAILYLVLVWTGLDGMAIAWLGVGARRIDPGSEMKEMTTGTGKEGAGKVKRRRAGAGGQVGNGHTPREGFYPGMVNLSGTLCYMNSVLQSFASIPSLVIHLERIIALAIESDLPTPVTDALLDVLRDLNTPHARHPPALRPTPLLHALSTLPQVRRLLGTRDQQDAHELFVVLAEAVSDEAVKVAAEYARSRGLGDISTLQGYISGTVNRADQEGPKQRQRARGVAQPWEGLLARRRVCKRCGWSEAIRMDTLGGMELPLPVNGDVALESCIAEYLAPENLSDVTCEMCSLRQTITHYGAEADRLLGVVSTGSSSDATSSGSGAFAALEDADLVTAATSTSPVTSSRKKRAAVARKVEARLRSMLESNTVSNFGEAVLPPTHGSAGTAALPIKWQTVRSDSFREAAVSRPPTMLRLHLVRSEFTPWGNIVKKTARVAFPMVLDLTRFTTKGVWEDRASIQELLAKNRLAGGSGSGSGNGEGEGSGRRAVYRLESAIMHLGYTHSSGHYICFRRIPSEAGKRNGEGDESEGGEGSGDRRPIAATKSCPDGCVCQSCIYFGQVRPDPPAIPGKGWLQISDADVEEVGEEVLLSARGSVFMLFYELVGEYRPRPQEVQVQSSVAE